MIALIKAADFKASLGNVKLYGDNVAALMDLELGRVDAVLVDSSVGRYYMQKKQGVFKVIDKTWVKKNSASVCVKKILCSEINLTAFSNK